MAPKEFVLTTTAWDSLARTFLASNFIGVDEAGRGPLAGPVCAAAVVLPATHTITKLRDSKKISESERASLELEIKKIALGYSVAFVEQDEIDRINILNAALLAMAKAVSALCLDLPVVVDGNRSIPTIINRQHAVVKGDSKSASVAAASILAKVARDRVMDGLDKQYPQYGFAKHKGYPTTYHYEMIRKYGASPVHRLTFKGVV